MLVAPTAPPIYLPNLGMDFVFSSNKSICADCACPLFRNICACPLFRNIICVCVAFLLLLRLLGAQRINAPMMSMALQSASAAAAEAGSASGSGGGGTSSSAAGAGAAGAAGSGRPQSILKQLRGYQATAVEAIEQQGGNWLVVAKTGSGKTAIVIELARRLLLKDPKSKILMLVPQVALSCQQAAAFITVGSVLGCVSSSCSYVLYCCLH
jgi:hypothetical protein